MKDAAPEHGLSPSDGMTTDRWPQIKEILLDALDLQPSERPRFLDLRCGSDSDLRDEVLYYLAAEDEVESFIERPAFDLLAGREPERRTGEEVGTYRLVEWLGQGGMGEVYRAERTDGLFEHEVAVKILKRGLDTVDILERFQRERRILGSLNHPNIARIYDGGTTDDGLPYLVMELVRGTAIHRYCTDQELSLTERLQLFRAVCQTVHAAHQSLIVHRDLKPENILVADDGTPTLLDFGIAQVLDPGTGSGPTRTLREQRIATPAWSSPEQLSGHRVTTATDVYSLGALLYLLLADKAPFRRGDRSTDALIQEVLHQQPTRPSAIVLKEGSHATLARSSSQRHLRQRLRGDLDRIVFKAMHKEPERRYPSAAELAEDVRRHLDNEPLSARADSFWYRVDRFVRRNPIGVAVACGVLLLVLGFSAALAVQLRKTEAERAGAEKARNFGRLSMEMTLDLLGDVGPSSSDPITAERVRGLVNTMRASLKGLPPMDQALASDRIGFVLDRLGFHQEASQDFRTAKRLFEAADQTDPWIYARLLNNMGLNALHQDEPRVGEKLVREAIGVLDTAQLPLPAERAKMRTNLATALENQNREEEAEAIYREVLATKSDLFGTRHLEYAVTLNNLGQLLVQLDRFSEAEPLIRQAVRIRRDSLGADHSWVATTLINLGVLQLERGDSTAAVEDFREALQIRRQSFSIENPNLSRAMSALGYALLIRGSEQDLIEAETLLREAHAAHAASEGPTHVHTLVMQRNLAAVLLARGHFEEGSHHAQEALDGLRQIYPPAHWRIADAHSVWGYALLRLGRTRAAEPLIRNGFELILVAKGEGATYTRAARQRLQELEKVLARSPSGS